MLGDGRSISCDAIGIHRWKILARGPAGHWLGGGLPNTNQGIARAGDRILALRHAGRPAIMARAAIRAYTVRTSAVGARNALGRPAPASGTPCWSASCIASTNVSTSWSVV